ncbi:MAG: threonylcarbamoyl-AMP synthase [Tenericutes bacterium]|nr:threonylcarbamoyl-AMP synthase [Mycoplasmatota bacterium]
MILNQDNYLNFDLSNKVIVFPTDTVYGIGCLYEDEEAIKKIYDIKGRDFSKPMVILCSNLEQVHSLIKENQDIPEKLKKHWPGKLTIIFFKNENICDIITSGKETVGIRIPGNKISMELLNKYGPMVVTSLNYSNKPAITKFKDVLEFEDVVDFIVQGPDLYSAPSTVYDLANDIVLRQGEVVIR